MKKLFLILLFIYSNTLFYSCSRVTDCTITKRHFRNGYYIETCSFKKNEKNTKATLRTQSRSDKPEKATANQLADFDETNEDPPLVVLKVAPDLQTEAVNKISKGPKSKKIKSRLKTKPIAGSLSQENKPLKAASGNLEKVKKNSSPAQDENETAFSLLWIVIVAVLILWLIGFLSGGWLLGGLIHLLLIIALVLSILWLLRIL